MAFGIGYGPSQGYYGNVGGDPSQPFGGSYSNLSRHLGLGRFGGGTFSGADVPGQQESVFAGLNPTTRQYLDQPANAGATLNLFANSFRQSNPLVARVLPGLMPQLQANYGTWAAQQGGKITNPDGSQRPATFADYLEQTDAARMVHGLGAQERGERYSQRNAGTGIRFSGG